MNHSLAFDLPPAISNNLGWIVAGLIIVVGLFGIGFKDLLRFRLRRVLAIAHVCFSESIRRRILWITPVAILGVVVVASLQKPFDEQDAVRQITKFCIFATGMVVVISTIILACTNLPREIDNRVIFTVVTKPTTRLEIVLGKILGFSYVSAAILIIMGLFTWGYLHVKAYTLERDIADRLATGSYEPPAKPALEHYKTFGLLNAKTLAFPTSMQLYGRLPHPGDERHYFASDNYVMAPFVLPADTAAAALAQNPSLADPAKAIGMVIHLRVGFEPSATTKPANAGPPQVTVGIFDPGLNSVLINEINGGHPFTLNDPNGTDLNIPVAASYVAMLQQKYPYFYVTIMNGEGAPAFWVDSHPAQITVAMADPNQPPVTLDPSLPPHSEWAAAAQAAGTPLLFTARQGLYGQQQLRGSNVPGDSPVCVYEFRNVHTGSNRPNGVPVEMRFGVERGDDTTDAPTRLTLQVQNPVTGALTDPVTIAPENNRTAYATIPTAALASGNFNVVLRCLSPQQWVGVSPVALSVVQGESTFGLNLFKSLFILWLLTVLVISISIFCSTFLSWPIAVVLTLVILLGRWGVLEVGDAATAGLGRQFVQDFGVRDPANAQALSTTVEELNKMLNTVAVVLPDINQFSATDNIERGISIPLEQVLQAVLVLIGFGLPLSVLAYVFLKNKEVAP